MLVSTVMLKHSNADKHSNAAQHGNAGKMVVSTLLRGVCTLMLVSTKYSKAGKLSNV